MSTATETRPTDLETPLPVTRRRDLLSSLGALAAAMRPKQWVKNTVVLAPLVFTRELFELASMARAFAAFGLFCALASTVYLVNDLADAEADRLHPRKRLRPIASGALSPRLALAGAVALGGIALWGSIFLDTTFAFIAFVYVAINILYTVALKHMVLVDVFVLSAGFVLRAAAGAAVLGVMISPWLFLCTFFLALFLALGKRRHELATMVDPHMHRRSLADYSVHLIDQLVAILAAVTIGSYGLYTLADVTVARFGTENLIYTVPFVVFGIFRYLFLVYQREGGERPEHTLIADGTLLATVCAWTVAVVLIIYRF